MPDWLEPMAATLTQERFGGNDWLFERKFDGIRLLAYKNESGVGLYSRNRLPQQLPEITTAVANLPVHDVILDGEVTWDGRSGYHVFDICGGTESVTALRSRSAARFRTAALRTADARVAHSTGTVGARQGRRLGG